MKKYIIAIISILVLCFNAEAVDFNRDGQPDYLLFNKATRQTAIWYMNWTRVIGAKYGPTLPAGWNIVDTADFNRDTYPDLLLYNPSTRQTAVWYLRNNVYIGGAYSVVVPSGWVPVAAVDMDGDGTPDIVEFCPRTGQTKIIALNAPGIVKAQYEGPTLPVGWQIRKVIDINGDNLPDYVLFNPNTRQTAVWYLSNLQLISGHYVYTRVGSAFRPTLPSGWTIMDVADWNGDGTIDYVLFNPATRRTAIWLISRTNSFISGAYGPILPAGWQPPNRPCVYTVFPTTKNALAGGGNGSFVVGCDADCSWLAHPDNAWITILVDANGKGPDNVLYSVQPNTGPARIGKIEIWNQLGLNPTGTFITINQAAFTTTNNPSITIVSVVSTVTDHNNLWTDYSVTVTGTTTGTPWYYTYQAGWGNFGTINNTLSTNPENWKFTFGYTVFAGGSVIIPIWAEEYGSLGVLVASDNASLKLSY